MKWMLTGGIALGMIAEEVKEFKHKLNAGQSDSAALVAEEAFLALTEPFLPRAGLAVAAVTEECGCSGIDISIKELASD